MSSTKVVAAVVLVTILLVGFFAASMTGPSGFGKSEDDFEKWWNSIGAPAHYSIASVVNSKPLVDGWFDNGTVVWDRQANDSSMHVAVLVPSDLPAILNATNWLIVAYIPGTVLSIGDTVDVRGSMHDVTVNQTEVHFVQTSATKITGTVASTLQLSTLSATANSTNTNNNDDGMNFWIFYWIIVWNNGGYAASEDGDNGDYGDGYDGSDSGGGDGGDGGGDGGGDCVRPSLF